ncbi:hypothetical protein BXA50_06980 [Enterococcus faecium]|nr:hypothetical protein BXA50_06980 [Enterococcus faecium]
MKKPKNIRIMIMSYGASAIVSVISRKVLPTPIGYFFALFSIFDNYNTRKQKLTNTPEYKRHKTLGNVIPQTP